MTEVNNAQTVFLKTLGSGISQSTEYFLMITFNAGPCLCLKHTHTFSEKQEI